jgi:elongation factor Ts
MSAPAISASLVKELRDQTGAGMMDAKRALVETGGDIEAARVLLREGPGLRSEACRPRNDRGLVGYRISDSHGTMVAVGCETEPVSNNDEFQTFAKKCSTRSTPKASMRSQVWTRSGRS